MQTRLIVTSYVTWCPWKLGQGHQNLTKFLPIPILQYTKFGPNESNDSRDRVQTNCFGSKYDILSACVTLKMGSRSPKPTPFLRLSRWCIHASMVRIHRLFFQVKCRKNSILQSKSWWPWKLSQGHQIVIMSFANPSLLYNTPSLVWIHYIIQEMLLWYSCVPCDIENRSPKPITD